jgi:hypothetical protein
MRSLLNGHVRRVSTLTLTANFNEHTPKSSRISTQSGLKSEFHGNCTIALSEVV